MSTYDFSQIAKAIREPHHRPTGEKLKIWECPDPFVAPIFENSSREDGLKVEVLLIRAPAAVGKSTLARGFSAERSVPLLDLAQTAVATGSLKGILSDLRNDSHPIDAFHAADLPLVIDALDEGRVRSGENGFISFLETAAQTLAENRSVTNSPKLIMFGRPEAIQWAEFAFDDAGIVSSIFDVGYFDRTGARELIHAYAKSHASDDSLYHVHKEPVEKLIDSYFAKIESALGLAKGMLWESESGRSFAGYAPVLSTIGRLIPEIDNFQEALNRLDQTGTRDAWGVIETVLDAIIDRESGKLQGLVSSALTAKLPKEAYDKEEQLALLLQFAQGNPLSGTGRVTLPHADLAKYDDAIARWLPEHPFLKNGEFSNDVIASYVYAPAIVEDSVIRREADLLQLARQPFFWRSINSRLGEGTLIDGKYVGYILNSFWSDPLTTTHHVSLSDQSADGGVTIEMTWSTDHVSFQTTTPVCFMGLIRNSDINTKEHLKLIGVGDDYGKTFSIDNSVLRCTGLVELDASKVEVAGETWLDASFVNTTSQLSLEVNRNAKVGWGDQLQGVYPFSRYESTLDNPVENGDADPVVSLLSRCEERFQMGAVLTLNPDLSAPQGDPHTQWTLRAFPKAFPVLIKQMIEANLAELGTMPASGSGKVRVRVQKDFGELKELVERNAPEVEELANAVRAAL